MCPDFGRTAMNILQMVSDMDEVGGPSRTLYLLSSGLAGRGHKVSAAYYTGKGGVLAGRLEKDGIRAVNLGWNEKSLGHVKKIRLLSRIRNFVIKEGIEVIHAHHWDADWYGVLSALGVKARKIISVHGLSYIRWLKVYRNRYKYLVFPSVDNFICVTDSLAEELRKGFPVLKDRIVVIPNAPPPDFFLPPDGENRRRIRNEFGISDNDYLIGFVGNIAWVKGVEYLFEALGQLMSGAFKVLLAGACDPCKKKGYEDDLKASGLMSKVIFAGAREDIPAILDAIDLFVLPSVEEADPWALSEAMAKAKPIVATNVGGIARKIKDSYTGMLVPSRDSASLAKAMNFCMENRAKALEMGLEAKKFSAKNFPFERMIESYEKVYRLFD